MPVWITNGIPTGIGDARNLYSPAGTHYIGISLFSDDQHALITTAASGQTPQSAVQDIETGSVRSIGPKDRYVAASISTFFPGPSPDGKFCIQTDGGRYWQQSLEDNSVREFSGIGRGEKIINWHADSNNLFLAHPDGINAQVYNLNLTTGERKLWTIFSPPDKTATALDILSCLLRLTAPTSLTSRTESTPLSSSPRGLH